MLTCAKTDTFTPRCSPTMADECCCAPSTDGYACDQADIAATCYPGDLSGALGPLTIVASDGTQLDVPLPDPTLTRVDLVGHSIVIHAADGAAARIACAAIVEVSAPAPGPKPDTPDTPDTPAPDPAPAPEPAPTFPALGYKAVFPASAAVTGEITFTKPDHDSPIQIVASLTHVAGAHSPAW